MLEEIRCSKSSSWSPMWAWPGVWSGDEDVINGRYTSCITRSKCARGLVEHSGKEEKKRERERVVEIVFLNTQIYCRYPYVPVYITS